jgi:nitrite reductase/ring-hydroxylating ferredoxin subunit
MTTGSKIKYFFISLAFLLLPASCENNKNDVIPNEYIDFRMDITYDIIFRDLLSPGNSVLVSYLTNNWGSYSAGFDSSGIIVYRADLDNFFAYDRTCPYDYAIKNKVVRINVDFTEAICPVCSTYYSLPSGGQPISGPGRYPLKNYKTSYDGFRFLEVWNH